MFFYVELLKRELYDILLFFYLILINSEEVFLILYKNRNYRFLVIYSEKKFNEFDCIIRIFKIIVY